MLNFKINSTSKRTDFLKIGAIRTYPALARVLPAAPSRSRRVPSRRPGRQGPRGSELRVLPRVPARRAAQAPVATGLAAGQVGQGVGPD